MKHTFIDFIIVIQRGIWINEKKSLQVKEKLPQKVPSRYCRQRRSSVSETKVDRRLAALMDFEMSSILLWQ